MSRQSRRSGRRRAPVVGSRRTARDIFKGLLAMSMVSGLFAVAGLPAFAEQSDPSASAAVDLGASQSLVVASDIPAGAVARDVFTAPTGEQLAASLRQQAYINSGARALGDDYPWPFEATDDEGGTLSPLRYYYRECVDFVAWRLNRDAGYVTAPFKWTWSTLTPSGGDGSQWLYAWQSKGWPVSTTPVAGAVAYTGGNHIAYVKEVLDGGMIVLEEYNYVPHAYSTRTIPASSMVAFPYPPPQ